jgi:hypothetical protein
MRKEEVEVEESVTVKDNDRRAIDSMNRVQNGD